jgi:hypothetical protein
MEILIIVLFLTMYYFYHRVCQKIESVHTQLHNKINDLEHLIQGTGTYNPYSDDEEDDN